mmetsp:Transcript_28142/g.71229  ORF Transcript_28142/g.71229 Transcript_28142/m.71229 type:complete len:224 (+) Transcript_28142:92-763(+)
MELACSASRCSASPRRGSEVDTRPQVSASRPAGPAYSGMPVASRILLPGATPASASVNLSVSRVSLAYSLIARYGIPTSEVILPLTWATVVSMLTSSWYILPPGSSTCSRNGVQGLLPMVTTGPPGQSSGTTSYSSKLASSSASSTPLKNSGCWLSGPAPNLLLIFFFSSATVSVSSTSTRRICCFRLLMLTSYGIALPPTALPISGWLLCRLNHNPTSSGPG